jgi:hypothetical protein
VELVHAGQASADDDGVEIRNRRRSHADCSSRKLPSGGLSSG